MMEISVSSPVLRSKQSQLFIGAASGQRRRRWFLIAGSSREARPDNSACTKGRVFQRLLSPKPSPGRAQSTAERSIIASKFLSWRIGVCRDTACSESQSCPEMLLLIYLQELIR